MIDTDKMRDDLNRLLHKGLGIDEPCASACTHVVSHQGRGWTALGCANVLARRIEAIEGAS